MERNSNKNMIFEGVRYFSDQNLIDAIGLRAKDCVPRRKATHHIFPKSNYRELIYGG